MHSNSLFPVRDQYHLRIMRPVALKQIMSPSERRIDYDDQSMEFRTTTSPVMHDEWPPKIPAQCILESVTFKSSHIQTVRLGWLSHTHSHIHRPVGWCWLCNRMQHFSMIQPAAKDANRDSSKSFRVESYSVYICLRMMIMMMRPTSMQIWQKARNWAHRSSIGLLRRNYWWSNWSACFFLPLHVRVYIENSLLWTIFIVHSIILLYCPS